MPGTLYSFDASGGAEAPNPSGYINDVVLTANTPKSIAVPTGAAVVLFNSLASFFASYTPSGSGPNVIAVVPSTDITDGTGSELNPAQRNVRNTKSISLISPVACTVSLAFYS